MGVKNLWEILESCKKTLPLHHLQNKRVCIDLSCWMVQLAHVNKSHCSMKDKLYLKGLFHRIRALIALNCSIIFVTDGSIPGIKVSTYRRRLHLDNEGTRDESSSNQNTSLQRNMGSEFSCMIKEAKILGSTLGVPCIDGIEEGEAQCALLDSESLCDGCFSADSDIFLFGARTVYRDICLGEGGYVVCYEMADIEKKLGFGRNSLIALAVLLGCDYSPGVRGLGPELACQIVKSLGESAVLQRLASEELSVLKKANCSKKRNQVLGFNNKENIAPRDSNINVLQRLASEELSVLKKANCSKKRNQVLGFNNKENIAPRDSNINGHKSNLSKNDQFLQVMEAYLKPKCHLADSQMVQRVLGMHSFQRTRLLQTCHRFFEWPPEKTDEYILPKIAERDLRRFANLRSTSSRLGVQPPLDMMPLKCPVSEIIKRRKAQGKECFEVSWEDVNGLRSSIVPRELVESACPEKIVEFEEKIAEKKKPKPHKPRLKKSETNKSLSEAETKLQELVLEIEGTNSHGQNYRLIDEPLGNAGSYMEEVKMTKNTIKSCSDIETEVVNLCTPMAMKLNEKVETEIVDLLSPLSVVCPLKNRAVDVIDLSESETDVSPEHANKAKELRLFVASVRNDFSSSR